ncbi:hypothetical protein KJ910_04335 [Patescibacteria group bacterium]|nr:hypothetical protein [Patescibacteria group bacterium]MBU1907318.1 hypothetical protein [Patescibacteria group bacterium]
MRYLGLFTFSLIAINAILAIDASAQQVDPRLYTGYDQVTCESISGSHYWVAELGSCGACVCVNETVFEPRLRQGEGACIPVMTYQNYSNAVGVIDPVAPAVCPEETSVTAEPILEIRMPTYTGWDQATCEAARGLHYWDASLGECGICLCPRGYEFDARLAKGQGACIPTLTRENYIRATEERTPPLAAAPCLAEPEPEPEPAAEPKPAAVSEPATAVVPEPSPAPVVESAPEPEPPVEEPAPAAVEPTPEPEPVPTPAAAEPAPEPSSAEASEDEPEPTPAAKPEPEPVAEPEPVSTITCFGEQRPRTWATKDDDADGVENCWDECAGQLETKNHYQDNDGCPDEDPLAAVAAANAEAFDASAGNDPVPDIGAPEVEEYEGDSGPTAAERRAANQAAQRAKREQAKADRIAEREAKRQANELAKADHQAAAELREREVRDKKANQNRTQASSLYSFVSGQRVYDDKFPFDQTDSDHDSVPDELDSCPDEPEDLDVRNDTDGCPDPDNESHFRLEYDPDTRRLSGFELVDDHVDWFDEDDQLTPVAREIAYDLAGVMKNFDVGVTLNCYLPRPESGSSHETSEQAAKHARIFADQLIEQAQAVGVPDPGHRILSDGSARVGLASEEFLFVIRK